MAAHRRRALSAAPPIVVVMGVSGAGKTTVAAALAQRLALPFQEGDDLHPAGNIAKMQSGRPLGDADRAPWFAAIGDWIDARIADGEGGVITCSALKRAYRDLLRHGRPQVRFVYLRGSRALIAERIRGRTHAYMPASLLDSQFADLEPPNLDEGALMVDIGQPPQEQIDAIVRGLDGAAAAP
jgi:carbohydrate kinase (thermoresistant glucokinase family)